MLKARAQSACVVITALANKKASLAKLQSLNSFCWVEGKQHLLETVGSEEGQNNLRWHSVVNIKHRRSFVNDIQVWTAADCREVCYSYDRIVPPLLLSKEWSKSRDSKLWSNFFQGEHLGRWHVSACVTLQLRNCVQVCHMVGLVMDRPSCSAPQLLSPSTHYPGSSTNVLASIAEGVLHEHHVSSLHGWGCDAEKKMDVCFLPYLICFAYICMLAIVPFTLQLPFVSDRSFASQSWRVCTRVFVWMEGNPRLCKRNCM